MKNLILPFQCMELDAGNFLIASNKGIVRVNSPIIYKAAEKIQGIGWGSTITAENLDKLIVDLECDRKPAAVDFLYEIGVLRKVHEDFGRFNHIWLLHEQTTEIESLAEDISFLAGLPCKCTNDPACASDNEFVVLYTPQYDVQLIKRVQQHVMLRDNSPLLTCYLVARNFVIDGIYLPAAHTPCHFCQAAASILQRTHGSGFSPSMTAALRAISHKPPIAGLEYPILASDYAFCEVVLRNRVREIVGPHFQPLLSRSIFEMCQFSLDGYQLQRDTPYSSRDCEFCKQTTP